MLKTLESVQRRRFLFEHKSRDQASSTLQSHDSRDTCPVCGIELSSDDDSKAAHIDGCLREQQTQVGGVVGGDGGGATDSDSETYEEYTWCNRTRIRTTSLLSPQTRASEEDTVFITLHMYSETPFMLKKDNLDLRVYLYVRLKTLQKHTR